MSDTKKNAKYIRNIAVIAHVDHGKTTLIDTLFKTKNQFKVTERTMDRNDLERERGITILAKCTSIEWEKNGETYLINIVDTPGHADFGSEVQRGLKLVDGILILVDASEGVMNQTKFVIQEALKLRPKLQPIIVVNKIDREFAKPQWAAEEVLDLIFENDPEAVDCPIFYGSGREGYISQTIGEKESFGILLDKIVEVVHPPAINDENKLQMCVSMVDYDQFFGSVLIGKVFGGNLEIGKTIGSINQEGQFIESFRVNKMFRYLGPNREEITNAIAGQIIGVAGSKQTTVNDTLINSEAKKEDYKSLVIDAPAIEPATMCVCISPNTSPLAGKEGTKLTLRQMGDRLLQENKVNVGINVEPTENGYNVYCRGELQISVLVEQMRREGFELTISAPKILLKDGKEPLECVVIDTSQSKSNIVIQNMSKRGGELKEIKDMNNGVRMVFHITTRNLMGYRSEFNMDTEGDGTMTSSIIDFVPVVHREVTGKGLLISMANGTTTAYSLDKLSSRGVFYVGPQVEVYKGMIIGISNTEKDLEVNPVKAKEVTNMRASGTDDAIFLAPPRKVTLEQSISNIREDACIEVTPKSIRMRLK
jgi:GTP-binding protein